MVPSEQTEGLMQLVESAAQELSIDLNWHAVGGGSDANTIEPRIRMLMRVLEKLAA